MSGPPRVPARTAGYVVLTSMAAGLELIRNGWTETRADPPAPTDPPLPDDATDVTDAPEPAAT